jgi:hypothetical protein
VIPLIVVMVVIFGLMLFAWIAIGREQGPAPADVAIAYERAWADLDFTLLYDLSAPELRDGMNRDRFIKAKRAAYANAQHDHRIGATITVENSIVGNQTALIITNVDANGSPVRNNVMLERGSSGWQVVGYSLRSDDADAPQSPS